MSTSIQGRSLSDHLRKTEKRSVSRGQFTRSWRRDLVTNKPFLVVLVACPNCPRSPNDDIMIRQWFRPDGRFSFLQKNNVGFIKRLFCQRSWWIPRLRIFLTYMVLGKFSSFLKNLFKSKFWDLFRNKKLILTFPQTMYQKKLLPGPGCSGHTRLCLEYYLLQWHKHYFCEGLICENFTNQHHVCPKLLD